MIDFPTREELDSIKNFDAPFCLTMYLPFISPNAATNPNEIAFKNLLRRAENALLDAGAGTRHTRKTLRPARLLLQGREFWPVRRESLVLFMHPKLFRYYHVPGRGVPNSLSIARSFDTGPLEKVMKNDRTYYVLALSHNNVRLFKGNHYRLKPVHLKRFPTNMKAALRIDEYPKWQAKHMVAPARAGKGAEAVHGQYNVSQTDKIMLAAFFRRIDRRLHTFLNARQSPLVIAGAAYLLPIYRRANTYPQLLAQGITGNIEHARPDAVRKKAWALVKHGGTV